MFLLQVLAPTQAMSETHSYLISMVVIVPKVRLENASFGFTRLSLLFQSIGAVCCLEIENTPIVAYKSVTGCLSSRCLAMV